jgi:hypothetical protein
VFLIIAGLIILFSKHVIIQQTKQFPQIKVENALRHLCATKQNADLNVLNYQLTV